MYNKFLLPCWRLAGQITPEEWSIAGIESSTAFFLFHNVVVLIFFVGCSIYENYVTKVLGKRSIGPPALVIMNYLRDFSNTFTFTFIMINHMVHHGSYSAARRHLKTNIRLDDDKIFQMVVNLIAIIVLVVVVYTVQHDLLEPGDLIERLVISGSILPHVLSILYSLKLICLVRLVTLQFIRANSMLSDSLVRMGEKKLYHIGQDRLNQLLIHILSCHDFLHEVNAIVGTDFVVIMFDMYVAITYRLYSALMSLPPHELNISHIIYQLVITGMNFLWCTTTMASGALLTSQVLKTPKIIWDAAPYVEREDFRKKLTTYARQISCLPPDLNAKGIFKLNMKTFSHIVASTVTQLVILISLG